MFKPALLLFHFKFFIHFLFSQDQKDDLGKVAEESTQLGLKVTLKPGE